MGARTTKGVAEHRGKVRIRFMHRGKREQHVLDLAYNAANVKAARRMLDEIRSEIRFGTYDPAKWLPQLQRARRTITVDGADGEPDPMSFNAQGIAYVKACRANRLAESTISAYESMLKTHFYPTLGKKHVASITFADLCDVVGDIGWKTEKTRNNALTCLRGVFDTAIRGKIIRENPAAGLKNQPHEAEEPDPLSHEELDAALAAILKRYGEQMHNYFDFAAATGLRTSELIELAWTDIDWTRELARVSRAKVKGRVKVTKTKKRRDVELTDRALAALKRQKAHSLLAGGAIFLNPFTSAPFKDDYTPGASWKRSLADAGLRHRNAYQTRHTFASLALMAGAHPQWVARQLGHTGTNTLWKHYARWIEAADQGREKAKLNFAFGPKVVPDEAATGTK
jgi:integrase